MGYDYMGMERVPMDPRLVEKIRRSPVASAEQGAGWLGGWGGPGMYGVFASLPHDPRLTYAAVLEGHGTSSEIEVVTGLTEKQVTAALAYLDKKGLVSVEKEGI